MTTPTPSTAPAANQASAAAHYSLIQLVRYFLKLGTLGFGGPVALVGYMHRDLVEDRKWISEADYKEGLTLAQLAPGPLAAQLAIYLGYVHHRTLGATFAGVAFVVPSFLMVVALGWAYQLYGGLSWMQAVFYGVGSCVIGIMAHSAFKLTRKTIGKDWLLSAICLASAACTAITETEYVALFLLAGMLVWLVKSPPRFRGRSNINVSVILPLVPVRGRFFPRVPLAFRQWRSLTHWQDASGTADAVRNLELATISGFEMSGETETLVQIVLFFAKAGAFVFGSGLAIVPFLYSGVVNEYHWLDNQQFLDAVAVAMITPGPVVITVAFIGYLIAGLSGASLAAVATFLPCYVFTILPAPYFKKYGSRPGIVSFVDGVTAAAIGAICGAVIVLGRRTIFDDAWQPQLPKIAILAATLGLLVSEKKIPEPLIVLAAGLVGLVIFPYVGH